ncbi:aldolase [Methylocystis sp. JAN1]|uniref:aldolase/citrate lyase family protein n=1 Tax=Methylocystis sp. JAN1 TaxID=3397211 RepID=UPI003FA2A28D
MRSILIVEADARGVMASALASGASALLLRLGGRGARERDAARASVRDAIESAGELKERPRIFAQIAPASSELVDADLAALVSPYFDGVFLEACEGRAHIQQIAAKLSVREAEAGLPAGFVKIVALAAQTPAGIFALGDYHGASARLAGLAMDDSSPRGEARRIARALLVLGAAAAGVAAFDLAPDLDAAAPEAGCAAARREGFSGLVARSAGEIAAIERAFAGVIDKRPRSAP